MIDEDKLNALELFGENEYLRNQLHQKENIIKEVREYIKNLREDDEYLEELHFSYEDKYKVLEILDKVD